MSSVRVLVGTRKGAFVLTSDAKRAKWDVSGPHFGGWEIYHMKGSPADPNRLLAAELHDGDAGAVGAILKIYWSRWHRSFAELMLEVFGSDALVMGERHVGTGGSRAGRHNRQ